jgi:site-specific recombinase XerD
MEELRTNMYQSLSLVFFIRQSRASENSECTIYARLTSRGQRVELTTGLKVDPSRWSKEQHKVKGSNNSCKMINSCLEEFRNKVFAIYSGLLNKGEPFTVFDINNVMKGIGQNSTTVLNLIDMHNTRKKDLIGIDLKGATYKRYCTLRNHVENFIKIKFNKPDVHITEFSFPVLMEFEFYLKVKLGIGHNTAVKYIRNLRTVINYAIEIELLDKDPFVKYKSKVKEVVRGYLNQQELELIEDTRFSIERIQTVKDIFIFCCYTGLAYIDIFNLRMDQITMGIDGEMWIETRREKTSNPVRVMVLPPAWDIIKRYSNHNCRIIKNRVLPVLSNQKMNAYLKEIGDLCGIEKRLSTHLARHTFATTVTLQRGASIESVSKMLGHSNINTTQIYAKITNDKVSKDMLKLKQQFDEEKSIAEADQNNIKQSKVI